MSFFSKLAAYFGIKPSSDSPQVIRNIDYFSGSDVHVNHKLDIFLPVHSDAILSAERQIPIVVHVHGGGWVRGSRTNEWRGGPSVGRACAREGFVGVVVSYRLARSSFASFFSWTFIFGLIVLLIALIRRSWLVMASYMTVMVCFYVYRFFYKVRVPVNVEHMLDDLCRALVFIRDHIQEHCPQADPNRLFLSGHSAGAHLITLLVLDQSHFTRHNLSPSSIHGVIAMSGIYSLSNPVHDTTHHPGNWVFRILYSSNLLYPEGKQMKDYSPIEYIKDANEGDENHRPPFLVMSARFDMGLEVDARRFVERLQECHHRVEYHVISGMTTHGTIASRFSKHDAHRHFFSFIRQNI